MNNQWCEKYIPIPFLNKGRDWEGCDCWGLACLVYKTELGIELPSYLDEYSDAELDENVWKTFKREVPLYWERKKENVKFDIALFRVLGNPWHVGIMLDNTNYMLSTSCRIGTHIVDWSKNPLWKKCFLGGFRYVRNS